MYVNICSVDSGDDSGKDELKSEISLVHEIALKRNLSVNFEVNELWTIDTIPLFLVVPAAESRAERLIFWLWRLFVCLFVFLVVDRI